MRIHSFPEFDGISPAKGSSHRRFRFLGVVLFASCLSGCPILAQPTVKLPPSPLTASPHKPIHKHAAAAHKEAVETPPVEAPPAAPPTPKWPAFDQPVQAAVVWDSHGLSVNAANSSLSQILKDISTSTGIEIQGANADQRVFGVYGPGPARDVLSQVLQGSGYNVLMIGDQGQGVPRELLLSARLGAATQQAAVHNNQPQIVTQEDDDSQDDQPVQQETPLIHPGYQPGAPPRSPQQILQEMQQRQQQMQQQPGQPPN